MKNKSITFKLFIITLLSLLLFLTSVMFFQSLFFEKFYISEKTKTLQNNVLSLKNNIIKLSDSTTSFHTTDFQNIIYDFEDNNNAQIAFLNSNGVIQFTRHQYGSTDYKNNPDAIYKAINYWRVWDQAFYDVLVSNKTIIFKYRNSMTSTDFLVVVSPIQSNYKVTNIIFAVSPLQPVGEATIIMKKYYKYIFIATIILIIILSLIYSKMISKPLVKLNVAAKSMSDLDFSTKCIVNSNDEIGSLAKTLNFLSDKLNATLSQLQKANIQLKKDIEKERALEKLRKEFVADVSHELKTPISLIEGYAEALKDGIVSEDDVDFYTEVIIDEAKRMNSLVMDMLALSQLESKSYKIKIDNVNIYNLINSIYKKYSTTNTNVTILFEYNLIDKNVIVECDEFKVEEVLKNLISNALRHTPNEKNIIISIKEFNNDSIIIDVENEGSHIDEEDLKLIWNKFYRVDKSRSKLSGGTGLGLSITKNILELHNSYYGVKNTEKGVKFYFTLKKVLI